MKDRLNIEDGRCVLCSYQEKDCNCGYCDECLKPFDFDSHSGFIDCNDYKDNVLCDDCYLAKRNPDMCYNCKSISRQEELKHIHKLTKRFPIEVFDNAVIDLWICKDCYVILIKDKEHYDI